MLLSRIIRLCLVVTYVMFPNTSFGVHSLPPELVKVQIDFYDESFKFYINSLSTEAPDLIDSLKRIKTSPFDSDSSRNGWIEAFEKQVEKMLKSSHEKENFMRIKQKVGKTLFSYFQGSTFARVPFIRPMTHPKSKAPKTRRHEVKFKSAYSHEPHTMDVETYVNERFPKSLRTFLTEKKAPMFIHNGTCNDTIAYHNADGYTEAYRFESNRDGSESPYLLLRNPIDDSYHFAMCPVIGQDGVTRISEILGPVVHKAGGYVIKHEKPSPLFIIDEPHNSSLLKLDPIKDRVIIGFQNTIWGTLKRLAPDDWEKHQLTTSGADAALYVNKKTGERIINTWNVYGDELTEALETFYKRGARRFAFFGTAGGLADSIRVGDMLAPSRFYDEATKQWIPFQNCAGLISKEVKEVSQGWVPTLIDETIEKIKSMHSMGVDSIDIESKYFGKFAASHELNESLVALTVSDTPLSGHTFTDEHGTRTGGIGSIRDLAAAYILKSKCMKSQAIEVAVKQVTEQGSLLQSVNAPKSECSDTQTGMVVPVLLPDSILDP